jgi:hypothetical protein
MFAEELKQYVEHSLSVKDVSGNYDALFAPGNMFLHTQLFFLLCFICSIFHLGEGYQPIGSVTDDLGM